MEKHKKTNKLIVITGGVETLAFFSRQIAVFFEKTGYEIFFFRLDWSREDYVSLVRFCEPESTVLLTFNFQGIAGEEIFYPKQQENFWDNHKIRCLNILVEHPYYYHNELEKRPKQYAQICIDRGHLSYMKRFFPLIEVKGFLPLGGTEDTGLSVPLYGRCHDLVFTGNYSPPETFDRYLKGQGPEYEQFYRGMIDDLIGSPHQTVESVLERHTRNELGELTEEELKSCFGNLIFIEMFVRFHFRYQVLETLAEAGFSIFICGQGFEPLAAKFPGRIQTTKGLVDSAACLQALGRGKLSINVMPWFKDGGHDRIFNSMLNGAVCLSDDSIYLREVLRDGKDIVYYSLKNVTTSGELPSLAQRLLYQEAEQEEIRASAYHTATRFHTWKKRGELIAEWLE